MNRWLAVVGGVSMNLALGSLYAWSVFVAPPRVGIWLDPDRDIVGLHHRDRHLRGLFPSWPVAFRTPAVREYAPSSARHWSVWASFSAASRARSPICMSPLGSWWVSATALATPHPSRFGSKWFPDKRGLVVGLMVAGYGGGSAIVIPVANALIEGVGWRMTFRILGVVLFLMCMVGSLLLKNPPVGYRPEDGPRLRRQSVPTGTSRPARC